MGDQSDWAMAEAEDRSIKTYYLVISADGSMRAERSRFGPYTVQDFKDMGIYNKVFKWG